MDKTRRTTIEWLLPAGLAALALLIRLLPGERIVDDAYITFRYARNIVEGVGFVYNPGEHVLGTTTPLYTLLLAGLALVTGSREFPSLAVGLNAAAGGLSVALLYTLSRQLTGHAAPAVAASLLWAVAPFSVTFAIGGMETDLTIALLLATACVHVARRPRAVATLSALALLIRPDTAILLGLIWLDLLLARRRIPWKEGLLTLTLLAPWLVYGTLAFGSPLTSSIGAKSITYRLPSNAAAIRLLQHFATPFVNEDAILPPTGVLIVFAAYCGLYALGSLATLRRHPRTWPLVAYPVAYFAVFAIANPLLFRWYLSPPLPLYILLILAGAWTVSRDIGGSIAGRLSDRGGHRSAAHRFANLPFIIFALAALALTLGAWHLHPSHGPDRPAPEMAWFELELLYEEAADTVLANASPDQTLCAGDIGVLGYWTNLRILDTVGLVTPKASEYYPADPALYVINYAIPADLVLALDPDHIVILEVYGRKGLLPDPGFQARYRLVRKLDTSIYGSEGMLVFERRP